MGLGQDPIVSVMVVPTLTSKDTTLGWGTGHRENALRGSSVLHAGMGSFDFADASLREAPAALKMTIEVIRQTPDN